MGAHFVEGLVLTAPKMPEHQSHTPGRPRVEWDELYKQVSVAARAMLLRSPVPGLSHEDLAHDTWERFLSLEGLSKWDHCCPN